MTLQNRFIVWFLALNTILTHHATQVQGQAISEGSVHRCLRDYKIYDDEQERCVSKVGHTCIYNWIHQLNTGHNYMEQPDCVKNAFCSTEGLCVCKTKFYETSNGTCIPSANYMEPCNSEIRCNTPLKCKNGRCQCENDEACVGLAGQDCVNSSLCTSHATCSRQTNKCLCDDEFYADRDSGQCLPKVGRMGDCQEDLQCFNNQPGKNFVCVDGHCDCDPESSNFENVTIPMDTIRWAWGLDMTMSTVERCVGKAGHPCVNGFCTARGFCTALSDRTLRPICACLPGTLATNSGHCLFAHGESCESPKDCINELTCKNNECSCIYADQIYEEQVHKCFSRAGGPCGASPSTSSHLECIRTAKCWPIDTEEEEEGTGPGHCVCQHGYVETVEGDCAASYNAECDSKAACLSNLVCRDNKCQCDHFAQFNERERKCMALVGASCGMPKDDECVDHSYCKQSHPKFRGHCECQPGYFETSNYTCTRIQDFFSKNEVYNVL